MNLWNRSINKERREDLVNTIETTKNHPDKLMNDDDDDIVGMMTYDQ